MSHFPIIGIQLIQFLCMYITELLNEIIPGILGGAAVAFFLFKALVNNRIKRAQLKFQSSLDQEKLERRSQLDVIASIQKVRPISYEKKNIEALESAYAAVISTTFPRQYFRIKPITRNFSGSFEERETGKYFHLFSENFKAFSNAFDSVTEGYRNIEEISIYLDPEIEKKLLNTLENINSFYRRFYKEMLETHDNAQTLFNGKSYLPKSQRTFNFEEFNLSMRNRWFVITSAIREELKNDIRRKLRSEKA